MKLSLFRHINNLGIFLCLFLFLFLLNPYNLYTYFGYIVVAIILTKKKLLLSEIDRISILLLIFSLIYGLFYGLNPEGGSQYIFVYSVFPFGFYMLGKYIFIKLNGNTTKLFYFLFIFGIVYSLTPLISVLLNIREGGFGQLDRSLPLFWNGQLLTATIMGSFYTFNMCIPALLLKSETKNIKFKIIGIVLFLLSLACSLRIGTRTQLFLFLIILVSSLVYILPKQSFKRNITIIVLFIIALIFIAANVSFDLDQDWLSTFASRMEKGGSEDIASGGGRSERWVKSFKNIFEKPLGWEVNEFGYSHNLWLDILRRSGIIGFILSLIISIKSFFLVKSALKKRKADIEFNNQILVYFIGFNLVFMVEPIFEGIFAMYSSFCLFLGIVSKYATTSNGVN